MKPLYHYEPTTTDELLRKNATSENSLAEDYSELAAHAVRLERKLAACRECFSDLLDAVLHGDFSNGEWNTIEIEDAQKTLAATAP